MAYKYSYEENGAAHTVWLGNEAALNHRLRFAQKYHLRCVALRLADFVGLPALLRGCKRQ